MRDILFVVLIAFLAQPNLLAQETADKSRGEEPGLNENLKDLQPFLGTWVIDTKVGSAELNDVQPFIGKSVYSVGMDGNYMIAKLYLKDATNQFHLMNHEFWRWDREQAKIVIHRFSREGKHKTLEPQHEVKDGKLTVTTIRAEKGSPVPVQQTFRFIDDNSFSWKVLSITKDPPIDGIFKRQQ